MNLENFITKSNEFIITSLYFRILICFRNKLLLISEPISNFVNIFLDCDRRYIQPSIAQPFYRACVEASPTDAIFRVTKKYNSYHKSFFKVIFLSEFENQKVKFQFCFWRGALPSPPSTNYLHLRKVLRLISYRMPKSFHG